MGQRSSASSFVQAVERHGQGAGMVSVYVEDGRVISDFAGVKVDLAAKDARWLSSQLSRTADGDQLPAGLLANATVNGERGQAWLRVSPFSNDTVVVEFGSVALKMRPRQARWLSGELQIKALLADGVA